MSINQSLGFEVERLGENSFLMRLYRAGFDEHFGRFASQQAEMSTSMRLEKVGTLWGLCLQHEADVPEVVSACAMGAGVIKDQYMIASVRKICCDVWLDVFDRQGGCQNGDHREQLSAFWQISGWVLQACDSLIISRQYAALSALLEKIDVHTALDAAERAISLEVDDVHGGIEGDIVDRWRPLVCAGKLLMFKAIAVMMMPNNTSSASPGASSPMVAAVLHLQRYLNCIAGVQAQVYCDAECLEVSMRFVYLLMRSEDTKSAKEVLDTLMSTAARLKCNNNALGLVWETRMMVCLMWCGGLIKSHSEDGFHGSPGFNTKVGSLVALALEGLRYLADAEDLEHEPDLDAQGDASRRLDDVIRANSHDLNAIEVLGKVCAALVPRRRGMRLVLVVYASAFQTSDAGDEGSDAHEVSRKTFLLSVLGNLCMRLDATFVSSCPEACGVIPSLLSNRIVLRSLQADVGLARDIYALLWNVACDAGVMPVAMAELLTSARVLVELTQDVDSLRNVLLQLARVRARMGQFDVAYEIAGQAEQYDATAAMIVKLEIETTRAARVTGAGCSEHTSVFNVDTVKALLRAMFGPEEGITVHDGIDVVCRFLEDGRGPCLLIVAGLLLDGILRTATSSTPDTVLLLFQNLLALAKSTNDSSLLEVLYGWMQEDSTSFGLELSRVVKLASGAQRSWSTATNEGASTVSMEEIIASLKFIANETASMGIEELRADNPQRAQIAGMFAAQVLDTLREVDAEGRAGHAVASQICWTIACHAACLIDETDSIAGRRDNNLDWQPSKLLSGLDERGVKARADSKTMEALKYHANISALFVHIKNRSDLRASEALEETCKTDRLPTDANTLLDILGRLGPFPSMPLTLKKSLNLSVGVLNPDNPAYFDALRGLVTLAAVSKEDSGKLQLIHQVHELLISLPLGVNRVPPSAFVEWFYVHAWNAGAHDVALEGMEQHKLLSAAQRELLRKNNA